MMKRIFLISVAFLAALMPSFAQDVQQAAAEAAEAITTAPAAEAKIVTPKYWDNSLKTQINVGQTSLTNWAAGGDNTVSLQGFIDANANYKKNELFWNNRLQLDYGFLYASSKPILQKNADRIYLESKFGYKTEKMKNLYFSANYDFKSQFSNGYEYKTPGVDNIEEMARKDQIQAWKDARVLKSGFLAPAYTNLALGIDYTPTKWLTVNFAPVTGGFVIVRDTLLRQSYSMAPKKGVTEVKGGADLRNYRFELGAQLKLDVKVNVNDNFSYSSQVVLFSNYLDHPENLRVNWDNRFDWKIAKYFSFTLTTNLIYDDKIMIKSDKDIDKFPDGRQRVQFKETLAFGFTYTIVSKKN
ncbi:MAG: DUF3078 domain-containing protein [Bacteroidales bacterium]|nr:DUF3078 domain-containing protein [Bacteroidales bacterium]